MSLAHDTMHQEVYSMWMLIKMVLMTLAISLMPVISWGDDDGFGMDTEQRVIWDQDTGDIRYEHEYRYTGDEEMETEEDKERSPVAEDTFYDEYKEYLREQGVEEGLLLGW